MNRHSITTKISIFFALFVLLILIIAAGAMRANHFQQHRHFFDKIIHNEELWQLHAEPDKTIYIQEFEVSLLSQRETQRIVSEKKPKDMPHRPKPRQNSQSHGAPTPPFEKIKIYGDIFLGEIIVIETDAGKLGFKNESQNTTFYLYFSVILSAVLLGVTFLYIAIIKSLKPLKKLEEDIEAFGGGKKPTPGDYPQNEIGRIQRAFFNTSSKISSLIDAREIFLKNAAHELKTPVAKGVIVAHMLREEKHQERLLEIFSSMTQIIDGIMTAEEVIAKGFAPKIEPILLRGFAEKIRKKMLLGSEELFFDIESAAIVMADPKLLEIALGNLFENGVKFKNTKDAALCYFKNGKISVKNYGEPLDYEIERYYEPFFKETSIRNENGMGLGLYLVKKVLEIQGLKLSYAYENGAHVFSIG